MEGIIKIKIGKYNLTYKSTNLYRAGFYEALGTYLITYLELVQPWYKLYNFNSCNLTCSKGRYYNIYKVGFE